MLRVTLICLMLSGCTGLAFNTTLANDPGVRNAMLTSVRPGVTTERDVTTRWGRPTQKIREGAEISYVYRDMRNPPGFYAPQFGTSTAYVVIVFQYGLAVGAYSSDTEGCRATFAPRPPGHAFDNPSTLKPINCGSTNRPDVASEDRGRSTPTTDQTSAPGAGPAGSGQNGDWSTGKL